MKKYINIYNYDKRINIDIRFIYKSVRFALYELGVKDSYIYLYIVSKKRIQNINYKFRNKNVPTSVLSFESPKYFIYPNNQKVLGEIYISPVYIKENNMDLVYIIFHGVLHLCGFDHKINRDRIVMEKMENKLLEKFNKNK